MYLKDLIWISNNVNGLSKCRFGMWKWIIYWYVWGLKFKVGKMGEVGGIEFIIFDNFFF